MRKSKKPSTIQLLLQLPQQIISLVKVELKELKLELLSQGKYLGIGILLFAIALILLFWAIAALLTALIAAIALFLPLWLAALIIAVLFFIVCAGFALKGLRSFQRMSLMPRKTVQKVKEDIAEVQESFRRKVAEEEEREGGEA